MPMTAREVYPNPPLRLVSAELRFPVTRRAATSDVWDRLEDTFGAELPEVETLISLDKGIPTRPMALTPVLVRKSEAHDQALTLSFGAIRIEFSRYESYQQLRDFLTRVIASLDDLVSLNRITRIGLRYVNEISAPATGIEAQHAEPVQWDRFIRPELIPQLTGLPEPLRQSRFSTGMSFNSKDSSERTFLAYGSFADGTVVENGPLDLEEREGPCFLLDIDTYERRQRRETWAEGSAQVLEVLDKLHKNVENVFNYCITDQLKDEVFRVETPKSATMDDPAQRPQGGGHE